MQLTQLAHEYLTQHITDGSIAIDATAGNGYDTLKMAQLVGTAGKVIAIDVQARAIAATGQRLSAAGLSDRCELRQADHAQALIELCAPYKTRVSAITFNLGYLPGSDKCIQTTPSNTISALNAAARLLLPGGVLIVIAYRGHPGGLDEAERVELWMQQQAAAGGQIKCHEPTATRIPPILWVLRH